MCNEFNSFCFSTSRFYQIMLIYFIMIGTEKSLAQTSHSSANPKQDTSRTDIGTRPIRKAPQPSSSMFFPLRNSIPRNINLIGSTSITQVLEKHPELRGAVLNEYIRLQITNEIKIENNNKREFKTLSYWRADSRRRSETNDAALRSSI